jgi:hypothetical protein
MIGLILTLAVLGVVTYLVLQLPMPEPFKKVIYILAIVLLILIIVNAFGLVDVPIRRIR